MIENRDHAVVVLDPNHTGFTGIAFGGYAAGVLAARIGRIATVDFRRPPPAGVALQVVEGAGGSADLIGDDGAVILRGRPGAVDLDDADSPVPDPVSLPDAELAAAAYPGLRRHAFPACFGCGPDRTTANGLRLFTGPVAGRRLVAAPWVPQPWMADDGGVVTDPMVWAALDCPGAWAHLVHDPVPGRHVTARMAADLRGAVVVGVPHVVIAWPVGGTGTKREVGSAVLSADGAVLARASALWIALPK